MKSDRRATALGKLFSRLSGKVEGLVRKGTNPGEDLDGIRGSIQKLLDEARAVLLPLSAEVVREAYIEAVEDAGLEFGGPGDERVVQILQENLTLRLGDALYTVGRRADDVLREVSLQAVMEGERGGDSVPAMAQRLERVLEARGLSKTDPGRGKLVEVVGKDGKARNYQLGKYAEMVIRTTSREAQSAATAQTMLKTGMDLVTISEHKDTDGPDVCNVYEGNTYSLTGSSDEYPVLDQWPPFHPNCRHVMTPASVF